MNNIEKFEAKKKEFNRLLHQTFANEHGQKVLKQLTNWCNEIILDISTLDSAALNAARHRGRCDLIMHIKAGIQQYISTQDDEQEYMKYERANAAD